ncbi:hypothetical protein GWI33_001169 [Rhynchophorus ferrugineus]|uniref:Uncharacterized protein n=1 Tax=Rhynchophorus ferrugineus TaxID=354439 RepID=A0A834ILJ7_RHYFE|nr:hypothetical protein GWI33_001169 [Rhynchophorus ferrugineus]
MDKVNIVKNGPDSENIHSVCGLALTSNRTTMLRARYNPVYGNEYYLGDTRSIPDYRIHRSYDFYDFWPYRVRITFRNRPFRRWLTTPSLFRQSLYSNQSSLVKTSSSVSKYSLY